MEGISPPGQLNLRAEDLSGEWRRWIKSFEDYLLAMDLTANSKTAEKRKLALFRHCGGEDVREIYSQMEFNLEVSREITEIEEGVAGKKLEDVVKRFHEYCNPRTNIVLNGFQFHNSSRSGDTIGI